MEVVRRCGELKMPCLYSGVRIDFAFDKIIYDEEAVKALDIKARDLWNLCWLWTSIVPASSSQIRMNEATFYGDTAILRNFRIAGKSMQFV